MSKITVKHYLNKRLKPKLIDNKKKFPLYVQIVYKKNNLQIKSTIFGHIGNDTYYFSEIEFKNLKSEHIIFEINTEKNNIENIITILSEKANEIDFSNFREKLKNLSGFFLHSIELKIYDLFLIEVEALNIKIPEYFKSSEYSLIYDTIRFLNPKFDSNFSEYYLLCKEAYMIFSVGVNTNMNIGDLSFSIENDIYSMLLYEWTLGLGKKGFLEFALIHGKKIKTKEKTKEYYKKVISSIDKLIN